VTWVTMSSSAAPATTTSGAVCRTKPPSTGPTATRSSSATTA